MRWVISSAAFLVPLLLVIAIAGTCGSPGVAPAIGSQALGELRTWVGRNLSILDHYAARPGSQASEVLPHLALERFDLHGCDRHGNPWYRLAARPAGITCGVLRRSAATPARPEQAVGTGRLIPLAGGWSYWERRPPGAEPGP